MSTVTPRPTSARTLGEAFAQTVASRPDAVAVRDRDGLRSHTWAQLDACARRIATGLAALGVGPGDTVGLLLTNDLPFYEADLAAVLLGAVPVSIYATASAEQIEHIASDAGLKVVITQAAFLATALTGLSAHPEVTVVCVEEGTQPGPSWSELRASDALKDAHDSSADDLLTIIYTSGTTGLPKGVELTHQALLAASAAVSEMGKLSEDSRAISWLPLAHIAERIASYYCAVLEGFEVVVCPDPRAIASYLPVVQPTFFFAVPRFWEKLRTGIEAKVSALPETARAAVRAGVPEAVAPLRAAVGLGSLKVASIGAAPSSPDLIAFFRDLGVPLTEIYGMTEGCACCTSNPVDAVRIGSAGLPMPGVELRLAADGEVEMRGPTLMRGYRNMHEATAEAFTSDGFLRTGDVGRIDEDGYLWIVDRKKDLIISAGGKNMSPSMIEATIKSGAPAIGHLCVVGDARPYNVALVVPDPEVVGPPSSWDEATTALLTDAIERGNARLSRAEQIKRFVVVQTEWQPGGLELTPTQKLRRTAVNAAYATEIDALYAAPSTPDDLGSPQDKSGSCRPVHLPAPADRR